MSDIAKAGLLLVPHIDNLEATIARAVGGASGQSTKAGTSLGQSVGKGFGNGLVTSGIAVGAFSALTNAAMQSISSHVGDAVSRFDTLNQYPKTMELLGYSTESAEASIAKMSDRLQTLPTRLDDMVGTVQGIVAITGDLDQATDAGLALNDMLVASGSNQQLVTAAMEQFRQMLAKGKPEMEDWRSLTSAMPGQMQQLAEAMLGPTANANDLYAALGGGKNDPTITMDQLLNKMVELDTVGDEGITSFREQAETAAGGISTAFANMQNAVTKGIAGTFDAIGKENISSVLNDVKTGISEAFGTANDFVADVVPFAKDAYEALKPLAPQALTLVAAYSGFSVAGGKVMSLVSAVKSLTPEMGVLEKANTVLGTSFTPVGIGIAAVSAGLALGATAYLDYKKRQDDFRESTEGLLDVVSDTRALSGYSETIADVGRSAEFSAMSVDELAESTAKHVEEMRANTESAETQIAQLNTAQSIISEYAGKTDLTAGAQGRLAWALEYVNDQFGLSITQADVVAGKYTDQNGEVQNLTESLGALIEAKKEEARVDALSANLSLAYQDQTNAASTLAQAQRDYEDEVAWLMRNGGYSREKAESAVSGYTEGEELRKAQEAYDAATQAVTGYEEALGYAAAATSEAADEYDRLSATMGSGKFELFSAQLEKSGTNISMLSEDLRELGADTEAFSELSSDKLYKLAFDYDGTTASIVGDLRQWGIELANYNAVPIVNKDGTVTIDDAELEDAQGNIYTWNGSDLVDQNGVAAVDDIELTDAQGNVWVWNGTTLESKSGNVSIGGNLSSALDMARDFQGLPYDLGTKTGRVIMTTINQVASAVGSLVVSGSRRASGGIRLNAEGGIRKHADGAIATKAVPLDIVGEDGAEAIVPLTNRKYSQPFADVIAESVLAKAGDGRKNVNVNVTLDGDLLTGRARQRLLEFLDELAIMGAM